MKREPAVLPLPRRECEEYRERNVSSEKRVGYFDIIIRNFNLSYLRTDGVRRVYKKDRRNITLFLFTRDGCFPSATHNAIIDLEPDHN